jgi:hypothetical protein
MAGYDAAKPAGSIIPSPVQNNASVNARGILREISYLYFVLTRID